jgi:hypothetical protein
MRLQEYIDRERYLRESLVVLDTLVENLRLFIKEGKEESEVTVDDLVIPKEVSDDTIKQIVGMLAQWHESYTGELMDLKEQDV